MSFDLVHRGGNLRRLEQFLGGIKSEVADTNAADLASFDEFLQSSPCIGRRDIR